MTGSPPGGLKVAHASVPRPWKDTGHRPAQSSETFLLLCVLKLHDKKELFRASSPDARAQLLLGTYDVGQKGLRTSRNFMVYIVLNISLLLEFLKSYRNVPLRLSEPLWEHLNENLGGKKKQQPIIRSWIRAVRRSEK